MFGITFYHQTIRSIVTAFGTLFNDISITREAAGVQSVHIIHGGTGYTDGTYVVAITGNPGTGATVTLKVTGGIIISVANIVPGTGYNSTSDTTISAFNLTSLGAGSNANLSYDIGISKGAIVQTIKVPLFYGEAEKYLVRLKEDPNAGNTDPNQGPTQRPTQMVLPMMSFAMNGMNYDGTRKLPTANQNVSIKSTDNKTMRAQYNPVAYNLDFKLWIITRTVEDMLHIVEQIFPYFTPDFTITINDNTDLSMSRDIPIIISGTETQDTWDGTFNDRRTLLWTISFVAKAFLYPPTKDRKAIFEVINNIQDQTVPGVVRLTATPNPDTSFAGTVFTFTETIDIVDG